MRISPAPKFITEPIPTVASESSGCISPVSSIPLRLGATRSSRLSSPSTTTALEPRASAIYQTNARRKKAAAPMASGNSALFNPGGDCFELKEEPDFDQLLSPDGYISICGFGSLLSERSARSTFPELRDFRVARLRGFRRVFRHTAPVFFERGIAKEETGEISSLSVEPCEGETLIVTVFEIKGSEVPSFIEREHEFRFLAVRPEDLNGVPYAHLAVLCACYTDDEYFQVRCKGSKGIFFQRYGQFNIHKIWRDDILPCRVYLRHCVLAAQNLGEEAYGNFLDHTFISDRKTTIRNYLSSTGLGIMEEEPPEALKSRYGG